MALLGGKPIPFCSFTETLRDPSPSFVKQAEHHLCILVALLSQGAQQLQGNRVIAPSIRRKSVLEGCCNSRLCNGKDQQTGYCRFGDMHWVPNQTA